MPLQPSPHPHRPQLWPLRGLVSGDFPLSSPSFGRGEGARGRGEGQQPKLGPYVSANGAEPPREAQSVRRARRSTALLRPPSAPLV
jgi:hypothetical protein